jgi:hypothetical protein
VVGGTGSYSSLHGAGSLTGVGDLASLPFSFMDVLKLSIT